MPFNSKTKWSTLDTNERALLWEKYNTLIKQRATNAYNWGSMFVKSCIAINAGALAVTIAFIGNVLPIEKSDVYSSYRYVIYAFSIGLAAAAVLLLIATVKTYRDLCDEVVFFADMVRDDEDVSLTGRPTTGIGMNISWGVALGVLAGLVSIGAFAFGVYEGADLISSIRKSAT